jgi:hypothetical protein
MTESNKFSVAVTKLIEGNAEPALLATKAHAITLSADGTLTIQGEKQKRVLRPEMWDGYTVTWIEPKPAFGNAPDDGGATGGTAGQGASN